MSLRALILCSLLVVFGCTDAEDSAGLAARDASPGSRESLTFAALDPGQLPLLPNQMLLLSVQYKDAEGSALAGVTVDFSLVGAAAGASLSPTKSITDANGYATTTLRAGSTATELNVRARAGQDAYAYLPLSVNPAVGTSLSVGVRYTGQRSIASYTVTSLPGMTCEEALRAGLAGETAYHFSAPDQRATFSVGYDLSAAIVGWGKDDAGGKLASGCTGFTADVVEDPAAAKRTLTLELRDVDIRLASTLSLSLEINASAAAKRFVDASTGAVASVVSPSGAYSMFADADYLLDAVQRSLPAEGAAALAARRTAQTLSASLQPALAMQQAGPTAYGAALGKQLALRGASLIVGWSLGSSQLSAVAALSADGSQSSPLPSLPPASIVTRFAPESAALAVDSLRIELGLGSYGRTLLAGIDAATRSSSAGCGSAFASWWTKSALTDLVSAAAAQAACETSLTALDMAIGAELAKLDVGSASLQLAGSVPVHDRDDDGQVDDLGPGTLAGSWGSDTLQGALQTPQRTAFE